MRRLVLLAAAILALPGTAGAATYSVSAGGGGCGGADTTCGSIGEAAGAVGPGDVVNIAAGTYAENPEFVDENLTIRGAPGTVIIGTQTNQPTLRFTGDGANAVSLQGVVVAQNAAAGQPAVSQSGTAGLLVADSFLASTTGAGLLVSGSRNNIVQRATVLSTGASAVEVTSTDAGDKALTLDSSVLSGKADRAGLAVRTGDDLPASSAGDVTVNGRHVTIAGSQRGVELSASGAEGPALPQPNPAGNIAAAFTDSIILGQNPITTHPGGGLTVANTATLDVSTRNETAAAASALFVNPAGLDFHLRADAPVIDRGGLTPGESATDLDGQGRTTGAASDIGADEFVNRPPAAAVSVSAPRIAQGQSVTFDASRSSDPEAGTGGGIVEYRWAFGDGTTQVTQTPIVEHLYRAEGRFTALVAVVDRQGGGSAVASVEVAVVDGFAPAVAITEPAEGQAVTLNSTRTRTRRVRRNGRTIRQRVRERVPRTIRFEGTAVDRSGVSAVALVLLQEQAARRPSSSGQRCRYWDPAKGIVSVACGRPVFFLAKLNGTRWTYTLPRRRRPPAGRYRLFAAGTDRGGVFGNTLAASASQRPTVRFTLR